MKTASRLPQLAWIVTLSFIAAATYTAGAAEEKKPAGEAPKVTFDDHVRAVFREHCIVCHDQNQRSGGLALESFALTMEGGSSGEVVFEGIWTVPVCGPW